MAVLSGVRTGAIAVYRVRIQNPDGWIPHGPGLQNRSALLNDVNHCIELRLRYCERSALHRRDALACSRETEIRRGGDHHARQAVNLSQQLIVYQHAAVFGGKQIGPPARRQTDLQTAAPHLLGGLAYRLVFAHLAILEFRHPNLCQPLGLKQAHVFLVQDVTLPQ